MGTFLNKNIGIIGKTSFLSISGACSVDCQTLISLFKVPYDSVHDAFIHGLVGVFDTDANGISVSRYGFENAHNARIVFDSFDELPQVGFDMLFTINIQPTDCNLFILVVNDCRCILFLYSVKVLRVFNTQPCFRRTLYPTYKVVPFHEFWGVAFTCHKGTYDCYTFRWRIYFIRYRDSIASDHILFILRLPLLRIFRFDFVYLLFHTPPMIWIYHLECVCE